MWILLLLPFIGLLWVPFYNFQEPALFGFPFFYWYQLAWVPISSFLIWLVYRRRAPVIAVVTTQIMFSQGKQDASVWQPVSI